MPATMADETESAPGSTGSPGAEDNRPGNGTALPYAKAFVVQFAADSDPDHGHASGRIEHLETGRQARFVSMTDLVARLAALLGSGADKGAPPVR
jgi:hypothetical protein